jgi:2-C-methyl-D-erythritol 4-phosphate cytidylyltransferase
LIVAAGEGSRLGAGRRKALVPLGGPAARRAQPARLLALPELAPAVVVGHRDDRAALEGPGRMPCRARRCSSTAAPAARTRCSPGCAPCPTSRRAELVLVHDAARPVRARRRDSGTDRPRAADRRRDPGVPVVDTIKEARADRPDSAAARSRASAVGRPDAAGLPPRRAARRCSSRRTPSGAP